MGKFQNSGLMGCSQGKKKPTGCEDTKEMINCETGLLTYTTHKINQNKSKI